MMSGRRAIPIGRAVGPDLPAAAGTSAETARAAAAAPLRLALFQPDMPGNLGAAMRLAAALDLTLDVIEPCGFPLDDRRLRRAAMDYRGRARLVRHRDWMQFRQRTTGSRLVLLSTRARCRYHRFTFDFGDVLLLGRESAGVPEEVHAAADATVRVPLAPGTRSLNVVVAAAMVAGEALRQLRKFPSGPHEDAGDERDER